MGASCVSCYSSNKKSKQNKEVSLGGKNELKRITTEYNNDDQYFSKEDQAYYKQYLNNEDFDSTKINIDYDTIGTLKKGKLLGEGSFGKVYEAFDENKGKMVAVKEFKIKLISELSDERLQSLKDEAYLLAKLNHPNIVKFYGVISNESTFMILLELVAGGSIAKLIDTYKPFPENVLKKYTYQILKGLEYLHIHNVIHRDIKGANILVDRDGICKLSDFGGSKVITDEIEYRQKNSLKGTPHWMAPEIIKSMEYTRYSDIWALGCTIFEMLTGNPPFSQFRNAMSALYNIMNLSEPPELPKEIQVSDECRHFIKCCMAINPKERWNVRKLLNHDFITKKLKKKKLKKQVEKENEQVIGVEKAKEILIEKEINLDVNFNEKKNETMATGIFENEKIQSDTNIKKIEEKKGNQPNQGINRIRRKLG